MKMEMVHLYRDEKVLDTKVFWALEYSEQGKKKSHMNHTVITLPPPHYFRVPSSEEAWLEIFEEVEFPARIGRNGWQTCHDTGTMAHNIWVLVDATYTFLYIDVGYPGRICDGGVFKRIQLYRKLENGQLIVPQPQIGTKISVHRRSSIYDIGRSFELNSYIMKQFKVRPTLPSYSKKIMFYYHISRACHIVENTLDAMCLVMRFLRIPIQLKQTSLLSLVVTEEYLRLQGHLIKNQIDDLFQVHCGITQHPMHCSI
ncbi:hypothetical protein PR048_012761 [Dryococelus australis]|uniref:DDE Tnp4 domain-containing protein n=1 Tax=Dryococelus australis TaxID=614101 RepID=A0ABQ9HQJ2_9NEOP|nr:hypothetical protein PR048_012761 [Dryococelus australis]